MKTNLSVLAAAVLSLGLASGVSAQGAGAASAAGQTATGSGAGGAPAGAEASRQTASEAVAPRNGTDPSAASRSSDASAPRAAGGKNATSLDRGERRFIEDAAKDGIAEVELGRLAQQKGSSDQVKQFAARLVQDHTQANTELKQIATAKSVEVPTELDRKARNQIEKLQKLSGAEFDREYIEHMVDEHKKDTSAFEKQAKSAEDPDLKSFAARTLPTLQEHLKTARQLDETMKSAKKRNGKVGS